MDRIPAACLCSVACLAATVAAVHVARSQNNTHTRETIPVIQMDNVPLKDAISNLAQQTGENYILDPGLGSPWVGPDGKPGQQPSVTVRWENLSAEEALGRLLKEHGMAMVANPATSIARIAFTNQAITAVPAGAVGGTTNLIIPLVRMDDVPLDLAIQKLAAEAHLRLASDSALSVPSAQPGRGASSRPTVSVRWKNVTARQALTALLDNYSLLLVEDSATASARIVAKAQAQAGKSAQGK